MVMALLTALALASTDVQVVAEPSALLEGQTGNLHVMLVQEGTMDTLVLVSAPTINNCEKPSAVVLAW